MVREDKYHNINVGLLNYAVRGSAQHWLSTEIFTDLEPGNPPAHPMRGRHCTVFLALNNCTTPVGMSDA